MKKDILLNGASPMKQNQGFSARKQKIKLNSKTANASPSSHGLLIVLENQCQF
jgi:hypothetical protein